MNPRQRAILRAAHERALARYLERRDLQAFAVEIGRAERTFAAIEAIILRMQEREERVA